MDPEGCPFAGTCRCKPCPHYDTNQCVSECEAKGQTSIACARDNSGCSICECKCIEYNAIQCAAKCAEKKQILGSVGKNEFGCDECMCCNKVNILECDEKCSRHGEKRIHATNALGCPVCACECKTYNAHGDKECKAITTKESNKGIKVGHIFMI